MMSYTTNWNLLLIDTVDAVVSGHPRDAKKVSGHLREYIVCIVVDKNRVL